jgi:hypothetical protein
VLHQTSPGGKVTNMHILQREELRIYPYIVACPLVISRFSFIFQGKISHENVIEYEIDMIAH